MKEIFNVLISIMIIVCLSGCEFAVENSVPAWKQTEPLQETESTVDFLAVGDNLIHSYIYRQASANAGGKGFDFTPAYRMVRDDVENADLAFINQETPIGGTQLGLSTYPLFNSPQELIDNTSQVGFDIYNTATNHVLDKGEAGVSNIVSYFENHSAITMVGAYKKNDRNFRKIEKNGITIGLMAYTYGTNGLSLSSDSDYYIPYIDNKEKIAAEISNSDKEVDFLIVSMHWGNEDTTKPTEEQKDYARILSENGADVIIGTHPHVIEPVEYVGNTLVYYSLGNFISSQRQPYNVIEGMAKFQLYKKGDVKEVRNASFIPLINYYTGADCRDIHAMYFRDFTPALADAHGLNSRSPNKNLTYDYADKFIKNLIDEKFLKY